MGFQEILHGVPDILGNFKFSVQDATWKRVPNFLEGYHMVRGCHISWGVK